MTRIAAPDYVSRHDLGACPPGHRFGLYLSLWNGTWSFDDGEKTQALVRVAPLGNDAAALLGPLRERQRQLAAAVPDARRLVVDALATSPFSTGLGNEHPVENGFAFLSPYGLPYLAGSGVKGVLKRAAQELLSESAPGFAPPLIDALFGPEDSEAGKVPDDERRRGALVCWDVFPSPPGDRLAVEVMTPHAGDYYRGQQEPHDAGQPVPVPFLALPAGSALRFIVTFEPALWPGDLPAGGWHALVQAAFDRAFDWLGFGAKTAVGYGAMRRADALARQTQAVQAPAAPIAPAASSRDNEAVWSDVALTWNKGPRRLTALHPDKRSAHVDGDKAVTFIAQLPEAAAQRLKGGKSVKASVRVGLRGNWTKLLAPVIDRSQT